MQTEALIAAAKYFTTQAGELDTSVDKKLASLAISPDAYPAKCRDSAKAYQQMHAALARLLPALHAEVTAVGAALAAVAANYEACEQRNGQNFSYDAHGDPGTVPS